MITHKKSAAAALGALILLLCTLAQANTAALPDVELSPEEEAEIEAMVLPVPEAWIGDFDGMRKYRLVRVLVPYSRTFFSVNRGRQQGISRAWAASERRIKAFSDPPNDEGVTGQQWVCPHR